MGRIFSFMLLLFAFFSFSVSLFASQATRIYPENLEYLGAFRLPNDSGELATWEYGGFALAYYPDGNPNGPNDGFPGSLFSAGFSPGEGSSVKYVSEISIPIPGKGPVENLNRAETLQEFADITGGWYDIALSGLEIRRLRGLTFLGESYGLPNKIFWSVFSEYNVANNDNDSIGYSDLNLSNPHAEGCWKLSDYKGRHVLGYSMFNIPKEWADEHLNGNYIATGTVSRADVSSKGPCLFAVAPYRYSSSNPPQENRMPIIPLIFYPEGHECPQYIQADRWTSGAWITVGGKSAIVFLGLKCIGEYCYGSAEHCNNDICNPYKGYHCYPRMPQMLFYDPDAIVEIINGEREIWDIFPYKVVDLRTLIPTYGECTYTQGAAYDRDRNLLYIIQEHGDGSRPLVHIFKINANDKRDVNQDGQVNISDVQLVVNVILGNATNSRADVNGDGNYTVSDVQEVVNGIVN